MPDMTSLPEFPGDDDPVLRQEVAEQIAAVEAESPSERDNALGAAEGLRQDLEARLQEAITDLQRMSQAAQESWRAAGLPEGIKTVGYEPANNPNGVYLRQEDGGYKYIGDAATLEWSALEPPYTIALGKTLHAVTVARVDGELAAAERSGLLDALITGDRTQLQSLQATITLCNREKGWYDTEVTFGDMIALIHSELSEALDAFRKHGLEDQTPVHDSLCGRIDEDPVVCGCSDILMKPEGVGSEIADTLIRILDLCERFGIDLDAEVERKIAFNWTRPYRHGGKRL